MSLRRIRKANVLAVLVLLGCTQRAYANGVSLYEKVATMDHGKFRLGLMSAERRPKSLQLLCAYGGLFRSNQRGSQDIKVAEAFTSFRNAINSEISQASEADIKAWKYFLLGRVLFESQRFDEAIPEFQRATAFATDTGLRATALHNVSVAYAIRHDMTHALSTIDRIRREFPGVAYNEELSTYPSCICEAAWDQCSSPGSLVGNEPVMELIQAKQKKIAVLAKAKATSGNEYASEAVELGKLYEKFCPIKTMYDTVCPDAALIYKEISQDFPAAPGADHAFLRVQMSKFSYEYEGDEIARSNDIVRLYGPFLEKYPNSPLSAGIQKSYEEAKRTLERGIQTR